MLSLLVICDGFGFINSRGVIFYDFPDMIRSVIYIGHFLRITSSQFVPSMHAQHSKKPIIPSMRVELKGSIEDQHR